MIKLWLALLLAFFRLGVEGEGGEGEGAGEGTGEGEGDGAGEGEGSGEGEGEGEGEGAGEGEGDGKAAAQEAAERRATADRERTERLERENAELRARVQPRGDDIEAQEDARLKAADITPLEKWQIESNRALRRNTSAAQQALFQAQDVNDRTAFQSISISDPTAKRYETRVEEELTKMRQKGQNAPREAIYTFLLGKDMREGKFKKAAPKPGATPAGTVNRGKLPGARSDVRGNGALSNRDKLAKKLDGVQI